MVNFKEIGLNKKLKKLEKEKLPTEPEIEKENNNLQEEEAAFEKKFRLKAKKHVKRKKAHK
jgi:hypothetical protein